MFKLIGQAKPHIMYLTGGDELMPEVESLSVLPVLEEEEGNVELETATVSTLSTAVPQLSWWS